MSYSPGGDEEAAASETGAAASSRPPDDVATTSDNASPPHEDKAIAERDIVLLDPDHPPRLDTFHFPWKSPVFYLLFLIFCNVAVPCVCFQSPHTLPRVARELTRCR